VLVGSLGSLYGLRSLSVDATHLVAMRRRPKAGVEAPNWLAQKGNARCEILMLDASALVAFAQRQHGLPAGAEVARIWARWDAAGRLLLLRLSAEDARRPPLQPTYRLMPALLALEEQVTPSTCMTIFWSALVRSTKARPHTGPGASVGRASNHNLRLLVDAIH